MLIFDREWQFSSYKREFEETKKGQVTNGTNVRMYKHSTKTMLYRCLYYT